MNSVIVKADLALFLKASKEFAESSVSANEITKSYGYGVMYDIVLFQQGLNKGGEVFLTEGLVKFIQALPSRVEYETSLGLGQGVSA